MAASNPELDSEYIRRILAGERHLFHELIRPCERAIYFMQLSLLRNEAEAEDAAQDTAIKIYLNLKNFRGDSQFRTWALSIARNEALGRLRKAGRVAKILWKRKPTNKPETIPLRSLPAGERFRRKHWSERS